MDEPARLGIGGIGVLWRNIGTKHAQPQQIRVVLRYDVVLSLVITTLGLGSNGRLSKILNK